MNTHRSIVFVSISTQVASDGGSYVSKYLESIPNMTGNGAFRVIARNNGHNGTYGHCQTKGNII